MPVVVRFVPELTLDLGVLLIFAVAWGLIMLVTPFVQALLIALKLILKATSFLVKILSIGQIKLGTGTERVEQAVSDSLREAASFASDGVGLFFHRLADLFVSIGDEVAALAGLVALLVYAFTRRAPGPHLEARVQRNRRHADVTKAQAKGIGARVAAHDQALSHAEAGAIGAGIAVRTKPLVSRIGALEGAVLPRLGALEHGIGVAIPSDIAGLRERTRAVEDLANGLRKRVGKLAHLVGVGSLAAVVAVGLASLGGSWIRCRNWRRIGRAGCRLPTDLLEALLGGAITAFVVSDLCRFTELLSRAAEQFEPLLLDFVAAEDVLIGCAGISKAPSLGVRAVSLPPVTGAVALPAL